MCQVRQSGGVGSSSSGADACADPHSTADGPPPMAQYDVPRIGHLIDGEISASDVRDIHDPGRLDDVVAQVAVGNADDVDRAVRAAHAAFPAWRDTPVAERAQKLFAAAE